MTVTPTIAIGVGKAGCRMVSALDEMVRQEGHQDQFKFLCIDTNRSDLQSESPPDINPQFLTKPDERDYWVNAQNTFSYLSPEFDLNKGQGVTRQRAVSRYHVDNRESFGTVRGYIETTIKKFVRVHETQVDKDVADVNIWILNSLGGGTGSGAFPLLSAVVHDITESLQYDFNICGLGSLPRLDDIEDDIEFPEGDAKYYSNAYAALRELAELINYRDDPDRYPIDIKIESEDPNIASDRIRLSESPFDYYWLVGFDEEQNGPSYREQMNRSAASTVFYHANQTENFPFDQNLRPFTLYSATTAEIRAPVQKAREFVELSDRITELESEIEDLTETIADSQETAKYLGDLLDLELDYEGVPSDTGAVDPELVRKCRNRAVSFRMSDAMGDEFDIDEIVGSLTAELAEDHIHDGEFDDEAAIARVYCQQLHDYIGDEISDHSFREQTEAVWEKQGSQLDESKYGYLRDEPAIDKWENGLEQYLYDRMTELREQAEAVSSVRVIRKNRLQNQAQEKEDDLTTLRNLHDEYRTLVELHEETRSRVASARQSLLDREQALEDRAERKRQAREDTRNNKRTAQNEREDLRQRLSEYQSRPGRVEVPIKNLDDLTEGTLDRTRSLDSLFREGLVDEADVARALSNTLRTSRQLTEPVQDVVRDMDAPNTNDILTVMTHSDNIGSETNVLELDVLEQRKAIDDQISEEFDYDFSDRPVALRDGFSIWLLGLYTPITLENTSEFGVLGEHYDDAGREVGDQIGGGQSDEDVTLSFAYPELFEDDERIQAAFGLGKAEADD